MGCLAKAVLVRPIRATTTVSKINEQR
jgi:hypothetical protein